MKFGDRLGANLRHLREGAGLSQEDLMSRAGVHRTQISLYERGKAVPRAEVLARLSRALNAGADDLFDGMTLEVEPARLVIEPIDEEEGDPA